MSGSTIGGVVGGVIGFFIGGPAGAQWGFMIGSFVGAVVDPDRIYGPRLTDVRDQAASDGVPRTYGYGRFPTTGNVIWRDIVKEVEEKSSGKGGPQQVTYRYTRSYAIAVCRGLISGYLIIKRNGKIVYDTRTDAELTAIGYSASDISETRAAQAKFMEVATLYYGDQATPDPTMVAVKGVGNVPNYTDTAFIVCTDDDVTDISGAVPQYEFVVADCGERTDSGMDNVFIGTSTISTGLRAAVRPMSSSGVWSGPADIDIGAGNTTTIINMTRFGEYLYALIGDSTFRRASINDLSDWEATVSSPGGGFSRCANAFGGRLWYWRQSSSTIHYLPSPDSPAFIEGHTFSGGFTSNGIVGMAGNGTQVIAFNGYGQLWGSSDNGSSFLLGAVFFYPDRFYTSQMAIDYNGSRFVIGGGDDYSAGAYYTDDNGQTVTKSVFTTLAPDASVNQIEYVSSGRWLATVTQGNSVVPGLYLSTDNGQTFGPISLPDDVYFNQQRLKSIAVDGITGRVVIAGQEYSTNDNKMYWSDDLTTWTPISLSGTNSYGINALYPAGANLTPIPDAPGFFIDPNTGLITGPGGTQIDSCTPTLGSIVAEQCISRNVTEIDVSELTDPVTGFRIASVSSPQKNIAALMPAFMFDGSEFDGTLHFPKRGRNVTFALTMDDLVEREGDPIQWERTQEPELLRKLTVGYIDPATTFTPTTQQWERRAGTVRAEGESTMELPIVAEKDWAAQVAEKAGKVAWSEADTLTFWLSRQWANLVPAAVGTITDDKGVTHRIRILRIEDDGGIRMIHAVRDRKDAYESTATGAQKPLPLFPGSYIRGPTLAAVMNMPVLRDEDDRPGLYWAASGMTDGWAGARLQVLRAGEWETLGDITSSSSVGVLVDGLPGHSGDIDEVNVMRIRMDETLPSVTFIQLLNERNPVAIVRPDHTVEVVQFQNATQISAGLWECTTLIRGNLDTDRSAHGAGSTVALLDGGIRFVDLRPDDLGKTLTFRVVTLGTDPDTAPTFDISFPYIWSSTEWPVAYLDVEKDGDDYTLTWIERRRLGTDADPIRSGNWDGYSVIYSYPGNSNEVTVTDPTHTFTLPGASDIDFTVAQLNRLTGRGPETTVNHE